MLIHPARFLFLLLAMVWAGIIFYLSSQPVIDTPMLFPGQDKLFHLIAFGLLGFLLMGAMKTTSSGYLTGQVWFTAALVASYGVLDEVHQYFVPGRTAEIYDALADATGGLLGAWSMSLLMCALVKHHPAAPHAH